MSSGCLLHLLPVLLISLHARCAGVVPHDRCTEAPVSQEGTMSLSNQASAQLRTLFPIPISSTKGWPHVPTTAMDEHDLSKAAATANTNTMHSFRAATAAYLDDERFSDFTIECAGIKHKVHRCFISAHSRYFAKCCGGTFLEAGTQSVTLKDDDPAAVGCMIRFFYCHHYDEAMFQPPKLLSAKSGRLNKIQLNALVYATAEKYEVLQ